MVIDRDGRGRDVKRGGERDCDTVRVGSQGVRDLRMREKDEAGMGCESWCLMKTGGENM